MRARARAHTQPLTDRRALSHDEAAEILKELNIFTSQQDFEEMFALLDVNESGVCV